MVSGGRVVAAVLMLASLLAPRAESQAARPPLVPARAARLAVRVVDENGEPVPGVTIGAVQIASDCRFGSNVFLWGSLPTPELEAAYRTRFAELCDFATLPFYWWAYERRADETQAPRIEAIAAWCATNGIAAKGHPLLWNKEDPIWLPDDVEKVWERSLQRVDDCVGGFAGRIDVWDVVNEATHYDRADVRGVRQTRTWNEVGVTEMIRTACARARAANPAAVLLVNDYRTDDAYAALIESLRQPDGGFPFDAIGIQSHMHGGVWSDARIDEVCDRFARFGLPLHFTEVTILSGSSPERSDPWPTTPAGEVRQAREVERLYRRLFARPEVAAITWWDLSDRGAWQGAPAGLLRADMTPKPAYTQLHELVTQEWRTDVKGTTDDEGLFTAEVYRGTYELSYDMPGAAERGGTVPLAVEVDGMRWGAELSEKGAEARVFLRLE